MIYKKISLIIFSLYLLNITRCDTDGETENNDVANIEEITPTDMSTESTSEIIESTTLYIPDEIWIRSALLDIAHYLRNYKFNEWDRRYYQEKPINKTIGYYASFPIPSLRSLHWKVYENCNDNFYKCIIYLHGIIETSPWTRADDTSEIINENIIPINDTIKKNLNQECKTGIENMEKSGLPFDGPLEKFQWRTSASYYMCWYTMLETPEMTALEASCDNFANCLDPVYGHKNKDPRADDRESFACATYSFCPDICCPIKHTKTLQNCYEDELNPCISENRNEDINKKICLMHRNNNQNFRDIVANRWNVTCNCADEGFLWKSEFGMCVDINECVSGTHNCSKESQTCLNLPGSFQCICKWGYTYDEDTQKCIEKPLFKESKDLSEHLTEHFSKIKRFIKWILKHFKL